jgi:uroporphyrin-III C-methyltransferase
MTDIRDIVARLGFDGPDFQPGHVWLAGAGPGGLECLTLGVIAALGTADAIVYDALVNPQVLGAATGECHFVGKRGGQPSASQDAINSLIVELAQQGKRVLRLKGGDPNIFGRGGEEAFALARAGIPFRFLPGITSGLAALAQAGIPATMRGTNKAIILATGHAPGTEDDLDWHALAQTGQPLVIYMGVRNLPVIVDSLVAGGLTSRTPAALLIAASTRDERVLVADLGSIVARAEAERITAPALIVVGDIVAKRAELAEILAKAKAS